jgi:hypothetical protein
MALSTGIYGASIPPAPGAAFTNHGAMNILLHVSVHTCEHSSKGDKWSAEVLGQRAFMFIFVVLGFNIGSHAC